MRLSYLKFEIGHICPENVSAFQIAVYSSLGIFFR